MKTWLRRFLGLLLIGQGFAEEQMRLIVCGMEKVFVIPSTDGAGERSWEWQVTDSKEIPATMRTSFATTDDCKPYAGLILITSSSGGVALVERASKKCLFHTTVKNAHSACLLPGERVAVASSFGGDEVRIFNRKESGVGIKPTAKIPLYGAHGVEWDEQRKVLWALGTGKLLKIQFGEDGAKITEEFKLPTSGGHDLSWWQKDTFAISVDDHCYLFDLKEEKFRPLASLADEKKVKSIDRLASSGKVVWHKGTETSWWSHAIRFLPEGKTKVMEGEKIYKVRWDLPRALPGDGLRE